MFANLDSSRKLIDCLRQDRAKREEIMSGIVVYEVANGRMCISNRKTNKFLPSTMTPWETAVKWDFKFFGFKKNISVFDVNFVLTPNSTILSVVTNTHTHPKKIMALEPTGFLFHTKGSVFVTKGVQALHHQWYQFRVLREFCDGTWTEAFCGQCLWLQQTSGWSATGCGFEIAIRDSSNINL